MKGVAISIAVVWLSGSIASAIGQHILTSGCGVTKGCFRAPNNCNSSDDCLHLVTFRLNPANNKSMIIEMSANTSGWVAFGLNSDERKMGGTRGHVCMTRNTGIQLMGFQNDGTDSDLMVLVANVTVLRTESLNGSLICRFERPLSAVGYLRPLTSKWHLVGAWGPGIEIEGSSVELRRHGTGDVFWTRDEFDLRQVANLDSSQYRWKVIMAHAACMILAWVFFSTFGMFMARYTRRDMTKKEMLGDKLWFQMHRLFMTTTVLLTFAGIVLIFIEVRGWSMEAGAHPYTGVYVTIIALYQPIGGIFRPALDSPRRKYFDWSHWGSSIVAIILSVVTMYLGLDLLDVEEYVLTIFVAGAAGIVAIVEICRIVTTRKALQVKDDDPNTLQMEQAQPTSSLMPKLRQIGMITISFLAGTIAIILVYDVHVKVKDYIDRI